MISLKADPEEHAVCDDMNPLLLVFAMTVNIIVSQREITSQ